MLQRDAWPATAGLRTPLRAALPLVLLAVALGAGSAPATEPLRLGALYPLSASQGGHGLEEARGVQVAVDLFNRRGGASGRRVVLELADAADSGSAWHQAHRLVRSGVPAIIGTYGSTQAIAASEVAHRAGVVYWETGAVADQVTARGYPEVFRTGPSGATLAAQAASFAVDVVAPRFGIPVPSLRVAVVYENDPYGASVGRGLEREASGRGFDLVGSFPYDPARERFDGIVPALAKLKPDVVVAASYLDDGARLRHRLLDADMRLKALIGKCAAFYSPEMAHLLGRKIDGVFVADKPMSVAPVALSAEGRLLERELRREYLERYGTPPPSAAYMGFSGAWAFLEHVLARVHTPTPAAIGRVASGVDLSEGSLPNGAGVRFAPPGDPMAGQNLRALGVVWQWQNGQPILVYPPAVARGTPVFG